MVRPRSIRLSSIFRRQLCCTAICLCSHCQAKSLLESTDIVEAPFCLFARHFIDSTAICEDIVSDVFVNMWSRIGTIDITATTTSST
ncbi:MAG: hypothetical protein PUC61_10600 [Bacteroidales bacterium]|nr:hypothetical protein [Bacteroidales bacterium]